MTADLNNLKKQYSVLQKKHKLPEFSDLNTDFEIEKLQERETDHLLRSVRRAMIEKLANIVRFLELLLNPSETPTPLFIYAMLKTINTDTRKVIEEIYKDLSSIELASLTLDISHNEKEEAEFIKNVYNSWKESQPKLKEVTKKLGMSWSKEKRASKGYFG